MESTDEMPDPIARSIHNLLDHMHAVDSKIERMSCALGELGHKECTGELPELKTELDDLGVIKLRIRTWLTLSFKLKPSYCWVLVFWQSFFMSAIAGRTC